MSIIRMPILKEGWPCYTPCHIPLAALSEQHALLYYQRPLEALAKQGGLSPAEIWLNINNKPLSHISYIDQQQALALLANVTRG